MPTQSTQDSILQRLPSIDGILQHPRVQALIGEYSRPLVLEEARSLVEELRSQALSDSLDEADLARAAAQIPERLRERISSRLSPALRKVINAYGVILHTNVGRAPISPAAARAMGELASSYSNLEFNLDSGKRGHRDLNFEARATRLLGCEAATVANNNAAALFLILNTLARGRNVLVSRGELIEIGGSFRLPSIMEASGAALREVGTTNKTRLPDYEQAIDEETALILRVHPSNYKITGFTLKPRLDEMADLARRSDIPLVEDVGSGYLFSTGHPALSQEPTVQEAVQAGIDLICFSGDKLLGGPQGGIIVGRSDLLGRIRKNPLMRACRVDKVTYAALEHVLIEYEQGRWQETLPVYRMLRATAEEIGSRASRIADQLARCGFQAEVVDGESLIGGGSAPEERLPTRLLSVQPSDLSAAQAERRLRRHDPPLLVRIEKDRLLLDLRTVFPDDDELIVQAFQSLLEE